jgi:colanic acid/amylovoran biosynthesis protein
VRDERVRILVEPSDYKLTNMGDAAMLKVAVARLRVLWPDASLEVFTDDSAGLIKQCPDATPLSMVGREQWVADEFLLPRLARRLPDSMTARRRRLERALRSRHPMVVASIKRARERRSGRSTAALDAFLDSVAEADLLVVSGMGGITDFFERYAFELLDVLALAICRRVPTAMFGQGLGPIYDRELWAHARSVLTRIDQLSLREGRAGGPLLASLGVDPRRVVVTGDDAIELAYERRQEQNIGGGIGVNLRKADYSGVDEELAGRLREILHLGAATLGAPLVSVPISRLPGERDADAIRSVVDDYRPFVDGGDELDSPESVIARIQQCRVVVVGSYHAAVFALAQGIPAIALFASPYYADKMQGLATQFGAGCEVVGLHDPDVSTALPSVLRNLWNRADEFKPALLDAARRQLEFSRAAYARLPQLVAQRISARRPAPVAR